MQTKLPNGTWIQCLMLFEGIYVPQDVKSICAIHYIITKSRPEIISTVLSTVQAFVFRDLPNGKWHKAKSSSKSQSIQGSGFYWNEKISKVQ